MNLEHRFLEALRQPLCDHCLGRTVGNLLSGMTNAQRGRNIRDHFAFLIDSGEGLQVDMSNFAGYKFRNSKLKTDAAARCSICNDFFDEKIDGVVARCVEKTKGIEFSSFLMGTIPTDEMQRSEEALWNKVGIDYVELIKSEMNREIGKRFEKATGKGFSLKDPDIVILADLKKDEVKVQVKSLYIAGEYQKLKRGIPQTRWMCNDCGGKGCVNCKGEGKMYKTSVHEIVGKPAMKAADGKDHAFHGSGREDIDARCLGWRPFVIEVVRPKIRRIDLRRIEKIVGRSGKLKVRKLAYCGKDYVRKIKADRHDKTYSVEVEFEGKIDAKLMPKIKSLKGLSIAQQTPNRVKHRRADLLRRRRVLDISYRKAGSKKMKIIVKGQAGLYIKELVSGDEGRTKPSVAELLNNKVKRIVLDVIKIHPVK